VSHNPESPIANFKSPTDRPYAVRALIVENQQILFIHHAFKKDTGLAGKWTFPGGRLDPDETDPVIALHREVHEELSVDIEILGCVGIFYSRSGMDYTIFAARPLGPIGPLKADEIRAVTWLTPAEVYEWHTRAKLQFGFEMQAVSTYLKQLAG
jgi:8-oxo-dGTP pyrophosphatase MutT (NUDIX family)